MSKELDAYTLHTYIDISYYMLQISIMTDCLLKQKYISHKRLSVKDCVQNYCDARHQTC